MLTVVFSTNCDEYGHGHSCHKVAGYKYVGKACSKDADASYDYFRKGLDPLLQLDQSDDLSSLQVVIKVTTPPVSVPVFWTLLYPIKITRGRFLPTPRLPVTPTGKLWSYFSASDLACQ